MYRRWAGGQVAGRVWDRWLLYILIGLAVGLAGFTAHLIIDMLAFVKVRGAARRGPAAVSDIRVLGIGSPGLFPARR